MQVYIGIDWSEEKHDIIFMNQAGADLVSLCIAHKPEGYAQFDRTRRKLGLATQDCLIGVETAYSLLVDYLWSHGYHNLYVRHPTRCMTTRVASGRAAPKTTRPMPA